MLKNDDIVSVQEDLTAGNYKQLLSTLRQIGRPIKLAWLKSTLSSTINKYTSNSEFKEFLIDKLETSKIFESSTIQNISQLNQLKNQLSQLALFLSVWKDDAKFESEIPATNQKRLRQLIKFKAPLDKEDRYAINIALQATTFILCQQSNNFIKHQEKKQNYAIDYALTDEATKKFNDISTKQGLLDFISDHIKSLNNFESNRYINVTNYELTSEQNQQEIEKIGGAISAFQTPNKKKKLIKYVGLLLAFVAALACGVSTGAAIIFLFPALSTTAFILGGLVAFFGFTANFGFFSKNFPDFILSLTKKGGMSEYIDIDGNRKQFSTTYKYLLTPLVIFSSLTVGAGTTALTYITILGLIAKSLPILAIIWPPLPLIIVGILAGAVGIALTVAVLTASLESLKKVAALNMGFKAFCYYAYKNCITWFKNLKNLKTHEKVGLFILLLLLPVGLAGLAYFRYTAGVDLSVFLGITGAIIMGVVAYIAQMAFICLSINKFKNALIRPFASTATQPAVDPLHSKSFLSRVKSVFSSIWYTLGLSVNAAGNAVLVYDGSSLSIAGAVACGVNSFTGSMSAPDTNQLNRKSATSALVEKISSFNTTNSDVSASTDAPNNSILTFNSNGTNGTYPKEPIVNLPSPTHSDPGTSNYAARNCNFTFFTSDDDIISVKEADEELVPNYCKK